ncbi:hypothetical protein [Persephonella sp. KM09-Lau-8]|uniref:hypothetical protein n=1 Tax=Persephonella sp. KM09-Lau-8 TaxID=1158345 RepID=UPI00049737C8|nr:hypothetical protein [Persephonella sp. KM09-Lau-8]
MKRLLLLLLAIFLPLFSSCINDDSGGSNSPSSGGSSEAYQEIQKLIDEGKLPKLDTSTSLRGKEVDGIREDVLKEIERKFKEKYKDKPGIYRALILSAWQAQRIFDADPKDREQVKHVFKLIEVSAECTTQAYDKYAIPYLEKKYGIKYPDFLNIKNAEKEYNKGLDEVLDNDIYIEAITFNTYERAKFYDKFSQTLSGTVSSDIDEKLNQADIGACEFMERIKKEWKKAGNITKIDFYKLIERMKKEREGQK